MEYASIVYSGSKFIFKSQTQHKESMGNIRQPIVVYKQHF